MCNKSCSSILVSKAFVVEVAKKGLEEIYQDRKLREEKYIAKEMQKKRFFGLGRNYTREEAVDRMWSDNDVMSTGWMIKSSYGIAEDKFNRILRAVEVGTDELWLNLSLEDAEFLQIWWKK